MPTLDLASREHAEKSPGITALAPLIVEPDEAERILEPIASVVNRASAMTFDALVSGSQSLTLWLMRGHEPDVIALGLAAAGLSALKRRGWAFEGAALLGAAAALAWLNQKPAKNQPDVGTESRF